MIQTLDPVLWVEYEADVLSLLNALSIRYCKMKHEMRVYSNGLDLFLLKTLTARLLVQN